MAMSRALGARSFTTVPSIATVPAVISSSPAIMRSSVDLPQPGRADQHDELAVVDREVDVAEHRQAWSP